MNGTASVARARVIGKSAAFAAALLLQACIFVPRTSSYYDVECKVTAREMTLEPAQVGRWNTNCSNEGCAGLLVAAGVVTAASIVVSGSIVVVGNVVYWLERRADCAQRAG